jgi:peroxiredoxin
MRLLTSWCAFYALLFASGPSVADPGPELGKLAPNFSLRDREGTLVSLADLAYSGPERPARPKKVVLLDFFRTDCAPCRRSVPRLVDLHRKFTGKPVQVILIALLEEDEGQEKLDRFLKNTPLPFLVLTDPYGAAAKRYVQKKSGGYEIPSCFVVDRSGVLRRRLQGITAEEHPKLVRLVEELAR